MAAGCWDVEISRGESAPAAEAADVDTNEVVASGTCVGGVSTPAVGRDPIPDVAMIVKSKGAPTNIPTRIRLTLFSPAVGFLGGDHSPGPVPCGYCP